MRVLVGKTFGIGNCVLSVPMLSALRSLKEVESLDVLVGSLPDDTGATLVMRYAADWDLVDQVYVDRVPPNVEHDVAIMAIPFDWRWQNGVHYRAARVMDERTRPDPSTTGLGSWKKHEVLYQLENAERLGFKDDGGWGHSARFFGGMWRRELVPTHPSQNVYLGLGYKKDAAGFWKFKHWGNDNYVGLVKRLYEQGLNVYTTGDMADLQLTIKPIIDASGGALKYVPCNLKDSFSVVAACRVYVGNDTGMMHVAASLNRKTAGIFMDPQLAVKNSPWTDDQDNSLSIPGWEGLGVEDVFNYLKRWL